MAVRTLKVMVVDDEAPSRRVVRQFLQHEPQTTLVAECSNGLEAVEMIASSSPDVVLLDIQMPELDGFDVIRRVGVSQMPAVIFITAYDAYAVKAFEVHALDYLLKPFTRQRFSEAIARARNSGSKGATGQQPRLKSLLKQWQYGAGDAPKKDVEGSVDKRQRVLVHDRQQVRSISLKDIFWLEAADHYVIVHSTTGKHLIHESLGGMEATLPETFVRVHRGAMVNVAHIAEIKPSRFGTYTVTLHSGTRLRVSRTFRIALRHLLTS
ncbi:MAG: response regulator transcription factor [bacterium]|nr:response regulator transcription factor [bacterium]